ncbi:hypothetical protein CFSAN002368_08145 [Clostridium botulinum A1 str. CFSAN002368]|nr:hypothetical protein CFSAN002368_08145 [Clostridium botulinum A1 str. CFSAN002368]
MKYENAQNVLPEHIIELIQEYMEGGYLYIPIKYENKKFGEKILVQKYFKKKKYRNLIDMKKEYPLKLAQQYYLTEHSIRRIIRQQKDI